MAQVQLAGEFVVVWRLQNIEQGFEGYSTVSSEPALLVTPLFLTNQAIAGRFWLARFVD